MLVLWWMPTGPHPCAPHHDSNNVIQLESNYSGSSAWREANDLVAIVIPGKVVGPALLARIKQFDQFPRQGIGHFSLDALVTIAQTAGKPEVFFIIGTPGGNWNDMVNF